MTARRTTIRQLPLTEVVDRNTSGATPVSITTPEGGTIYHTAPLADPAIGKRRDDRGQWITGTFPLFPVVRLADGAPWAEANLWLIDMNESKPSPNMLTTWWRSVVIWITRALTGWHSPRTSGNIQPTATAPRSGWPCRQANCLRASPGVVRAP